MARRDARVTPHDLTARVREVGADQWRDAKVIDLSSSGASFELESPFVLGTHVELALFSGDEPRVMLTAGVVRVDAQALEMGVHFTRMTPEMRVRVEHEVGLRRDALGSETVLTPRGPVSISAEALQTSSVYDALDLRSELSGDDLLLAISEVKSAVASAVDTAEDARRMRLIAIHGALAALAETLKSPRERAAYDFSFGIVRAAERLQAAERGSGLKAEDLRAIWQKLHPERVTRSQEILAKVESGELTDARAAIAEAAALDPFCADVSAREEERSRKTPGGTVEVPTPRPIFDRYEVIRRLALGGMGEVLLARESRDPSRVIILKSLLPELSHDPELVEQFLHEANIASQLDHPNIIRMQQVGRWIGRYYIAMEHVEGIDVGRLIRAAKEAGEPVPAEVAARICCDAALGLQAAHSATDGEGRPLGIVHRDVSPQNLMVRIDGVTKVVDFGISLSTDRATRTAAGVVKGKLPYMAPEQVRADAPDALLDQWALGVVLWEMLTGRKLFSGSNELELLKQVLAGRIEPPSSVVDDVPRPLEEIVMRALARDRKQRFPDCQQLAARLAVFLRETDRASHDDVGRFLTRVAAKDLEEVRRLREGREVDGEQGNFLIDLSPGKARAAHKRGVHGSLADMTLLEIIQSLEQSRRSAEVEVWLDGELIGIAGIDEGVVRYAACGKSTKEEGFHALMQIPDGTFAIRYGAPRQELADMDGPVSFLMLESLRRLDEGEAHISDIQAVDARYRLPGSGPPDDGAVASLQARAEAADRARLQEAEARVVAEQQAQAEAARREKLLENIRSTAEAMRVQVVAAEQARMEAERLAVDARAENERLESKMKSMPRRVSPVLAGALGVSLALGALAALQTQNADERAAAKRFREAVLLTHNGRLDEGIDMLEALRRERPDVVLVLRQLGDAYGKSGDRNRALEAYRTYVDSPDAPPDDVEKVRALIEAAMRR